MSELRSGRPTSVRLAADDLDRLDRLAEAYDRSRAWLIAEAVRRFLEEEEAFVAAVEEGLQSAESEPLLPHAEVRRRSRALLERLSRGRAAE